VIPELGGNTSEFLYYAKFRDHSEIFDENLFYHLATAFFRDHLGEQTKEIVDRNVSFQRHFALNWLTRLLGENGWDDTDIST
jgi:hypothetical protein